MSVWLSVTRRYMYCVWTVAPILKLSLPSGSPIILVFLTPCADTQFHGEPLQGVLNKRGWEKLWFLTEIAVYLGNGARYAHGCYGMLIGSHRWRIDPCRFRWPCVTFDSYFKVTTFFEVKYLKYLRDKVTIAN